MLRSYLGTVFEGGRVSLKHRLLEEIMVGCWYSINSYALRWYWYQYEAYSLPKPLRCTRVPTLRLSCPHVKRLALSY